MIQVLNITSAGDQGGGGRTEVTSQQDYSVRRRPGGVSHSRMIQSSGVRMPAVSTLSELQTGGGGVGIDSATEDVTSQSVPYSGMVRDGRQL